MSTDKSRRLHRLRRRLRSRWSAGRLPLSAIMPATHTGGLSRKMLSTLHSEPHPAMSWAGVRQEVRYCVRCRRCRLSPSGEGGCSARNQILCSHRRMGLDADGLVRRILPGPARSWQRPALLQRPSTHPMAGGQCPPPGLVREEPLRKVIVCPGR
jgi:hypothetical protein